MLRGLGRRQGWGGRGGGVGGRGGGSGGKVDIEQLK